MMGWIKRLFGIKDNAPKDKINSIFIADDYRRKMKESKYRIRTIFDTKFGRRYNTGPFHTRMPKD